MDFLGSIDGQVGVYGTAIVESVQISIEIPQDEDTPPQPISHTVTFRANGALNRGAAVAADSTVPNPPNPKDLKIQYAIPATSPSWTTVCSAFRAGLAIAARNPLYRPGCGNGNTFRLAGNIDAQAEVTLYESEATALPAEGNPYSLRIYVAPSSYWEINWMNLEAIEPFEVPIETRQLVMANLRLAFVSATLVGSTPTRGHIKNPAGTVWWPSS